MRTIEKKEVIELTEKGQITVADFQGYQLTNEFQVGDLVKTNKTFASNSNLDEVIVGRIVSVRFKENGGFLDVVYSLDNGPDVYRTTIYDNELELATEAFVDEEIKKHEERIEQLRKLKAS